MGYRHGPATDCPTCRWEEMTRVERLIERLHQAAIGDSFQDVVRASSSFTVILTSIMAGQPAPDWYDKHRAEFERTGTKLELDRMLRHETGIGVLAA